MDVCVCVHMCVYVCVCVCVNVVVVVGGGDLSEPDFKPETLMQIQYLNT